MLGKRLLKLRKDNHVTQEMLGKAIGVKKTTISNYETGYSSPNPETLRKIANYFDTSIDYLLGRTEEPQIGLRWDPLYDFWIDKDGEFSLNLERIKPIDILNELRNENRIDDIQYTDFFNYRESNEGFHALGIPDEEIKKAYEKLSRRNKLEIINVLVELREWPDWRDWKKISKQASRAGITTQQLSSLINTIGAIISEIYYEDFNEK